MTFLRKLPLLFVACSLFISISLPVFAQGVVSGDDVCGASADKACNITHVKEITGNIFKVIISLGLPLLVVFVCYRFIIAWFQLNQGNANAYREAAQKAGNAILGFMIIVALMGGIFFAILRMAGVKTEYLDIFKNILVTSLVERAYAIDVIDGGAMMASCSFEDQRIFGTNCTLQSGTQGQPCGSNYTCRSGFECNAQMFCEKTPSTNPTFEEASQGAQAPRENMIGGSCGRDGICSEGVCDGASNTCVRGASAQGTSQQQAANVTGSLNPTNVTTLYDFILNILRLVMRFFVFPALIAIWVWTGFSFVLAQGAPEALAKAKKLLLWATISTFIIFMIQAFMTAVSGTVQKVLSEKTEIIERHL